MNGFKHMRKRAHVTQLSMARALDVDPSTICKWETGKALPHAGTLIRAADYLGCTVEELINVQHPAQEAEKAG